MEEFTYRIIFSARRSLSITVSPANGVIVRAPIRMSRQRIEAFVLEKSEWIKKHISRHTELIRLNGERVFTEGEEHFFMGKSYRLVLFKSTKPSVSLFDNELRVGLKYPSDGRKVKALMDRWYSAQARERFTPLMESIIERYSEYEFRPAKLIIRASRSRWGSCSGTGVISLSSELIKLDEKFYEYIILHELCHLKHHNHGAGFYRLLEKLKPDYREVRKDLRKYVMK
jgi:predicted metal-dependent hydrolase